MKTSDGARARDRPARGGDRALVIPLFTNVLPASTEAKNKLVNVTAVGHFGLIWRSCPRARTKPEEAAGETITP